MTTEISIFEYNMLTMRLFTTLALLFSTFGVFGQNAYTQDLYSYTVETDIEYGIATNYAGFDESLRLDLYKPLGDNNCNRPCVVLIHGGAWVQGSKDQPGNLILAEKFVKRGWVVAAISYRLGTHGPDIYNENYPSCPLFDDTVNIFRCWNTADSAEVIRANYRGQQDAKGAIRFMKGRHILDSTDIANFFVVGESAGGFIALATTFINATNEKPSECGAISDAPVPDSFLVDCLPVGYSLARPDLGSIDGTIALNGYDASVQGIGSFFGGTFGTDLFNNTTTWPSMYLFHQERDVIVSSGHLPVLNRFNACVATVCPPFDTFPYAYGSNSIDSFLTVIAAPVDIQFDFLQNSNGSADCSANGHTIDNVNLRTQNLISHFAQRIFENGNTPSSTCTNAILENTFNAPRIFPNPSNGEITIELNLSYHTSVSILTADGKLVNSFEAKAVQTIHLEEGIYFFHVSAVNGQNWTKKMVIL